MTTTPMNEFVIADALEALRGKRIPFRFSGREFLRIGKPVPLMEFSQDCCVSFLRDGSIQPYQELLSGTSLLIAPIEECRPETKNLNVIFTSHPEVAFYIVTQLMKPLPCPEIHATSVISSDAVIGKNVSIGALSCIGPGVTICDDVRIGENCSITNAFIGANTVLQTGVRIGSDSLGALKTGSGVWCDRPHFGRVKIGKNVRIEDNVVVNRGYLKDTTIGPEVRIGPMTWLGNGVTLGRGTIIAQSVTIAGSVTIAEDAAVWGNASIREGLTIGKGAVIGMGSVVLKRVPNYELWVGNPASFKINLRCQSEE